MTGQPVRPATRWHREGAALQCPGEGPDRPGVGESLEDLHIEDLTLAVEPAGRARDVTRDAAAALRAGLEQGFAPAVGATAHALLHLRRSAFWNCHGERGSVRSGRPDCRGRRGQPSGCHPVRGAGPLHHPLRACPPLNIGGRPRRGWGHPLHRSGDRPES